MFVAGVLFRDFAGGLHHFVHELFELGQTGGGNNDGVAPSANDLRDAEEAAARIFLEGNYERFAFDLNLVRLDGFFRDGRAILPHASATKTAAAGKSVGRIILVHNLTVPV